jgi:sporulation protein YunB
MKSIIKTKKKYIYKPKLYEKIIVLIFLIIFATFLWLDKFGDRLKKNIINYVETEVYKVASYIINKSVDLDDVYKFDIDKLFIITRNDNNIIESIDFNTVLVNAIIIDISKKIQVNLKYLEKGQIEKLAFKNDFLTEFNFDKKGDGMFYKVPMGVMFDNPILANFGPKIPIKYNLIGNIGANFENTIKSYGLNSSLFEVNLKITVTENIILPFVSKKIKIDSKNNIKITSKLESTLNFLKPSSNYTDTFTKEGTVLNKFDFYDSDGKRKSVFGTAMRTASQILPMFLHPAVGYT